MADVELPLSGHLEELRRRLARALLAVAAAFALCYPNAEFLFDLLTAPLLAAGAGTHANELGVELIGTGVAEAFFARLKVAFIAAVFVALPVVLYQGWMFVLPALKRREVQYVGPFVVFGTVFFLAGAGFSCVPGHIIRNAHVKITAPQGPKMHFCPAGTEFLEKCPAGPKIKEIS